jgi:hypothetical protein
MVDVFSPAGRAALYRVIESRRDVRAKALSINTGRRRGFLPSVCLARAHS